MKPRHSLLIILTLVLIASRAQAALQTFADKAAFLMATGASTATGPLPNRGVIPSDLGAVPTATVGSVIFSPATPPSDDNGLAIGALGVATPALATSTGEQGLGDEGRETDTQNPVDVYTFLCANLAPPEGPQFPMLLGPRVRVHDSGPIVAHNHLAVVIAGGLGRQVVDLSPPFTFRPEGSPFHVRQPEGDSPGASEYAAVNDRGFTCIDESIGSDIIDHRYIAVVKKTGPAAEGYVMEAQCRYRNQDNMTLITDPLERSLYLIIDQ